MRNSTKILIQIAASSVIGFFVMIAVAELLRSTIYFSLFIGIPAGFIAAVLVFITLWLLWR